jgi:hypothetical protein
MSAPSPLLSPDLLRQVNAVVNRFEAECLGGVCPAVESLVAGVPADAQPGCCAG